MYDLTLVRVIGFKRQRLESLMKENKVWFFFNSVFPFSSKFNALCSSTIDLDRTDNKIQLMCSFLITGIIK